MAMMFTLPFNDVQVTPGLVSTTTRDSPFSQVTQRSGKLFLLDTVNARSCLNKTAVLVDHVIGKRYDMCVATETWIKDTDSVSVAALSPVEYSFKNFAWPPNRSGSSTGVVFRDSVEINMVDDNRELSSFEYSERKAKVHNQNVRVVAVYRHPYSGEHPVTSGYIFRRVF